MTFGIEDVNVSTDIDRLKLEVMQLRESNNDSVKVLESSIQQMKNYCWSMYQTDPHTKTTFYNNIKGELMYVRDIIKYLNYCREMGNIIEGRFWVAESDTKSFSESVSVLLQSNKFEGISVNEEKFNKEVIKPPTKFRDLIFFRQFQKIVDTYGIPTYKEINPAVLTSVSFPFLFGLMYGDFAHGFALLIFGLILLINWKNISSSFQTIGHDIKSIGYLLSFMGFFSVYCGLVYNDFLALPLTIFSSCYEMPSYSISNKIKYHQIVFGILDLTGLGMKALNQFLF